jgi:hypothetical protein
MLNFRSTLHEKEHSLKNDLGCSCPCKDVQTDNKIMLPYIEEGLNDVIRKENKKKSQGNTGWTQAQKGIKWI